VAVRPRRGRDDRGQVGGIEVLPFGVLVFVVGALLVTNAWGVVDAKVATEAAAREAVHTYVEAPDGATGARRARAEVTLVLAEHGRRPDLAVVRIRGDGTFLRCAVVSVEVDYPVPAVRLPWIGGLGHAFDVHAVHSERIDPFRSGLTGHGTC
jgi:hypothetical protein